MSTNFRKVVEFNKTFGVKIYEKVDSSIFEKDPKLIQYRVSLIKEECRELNEAIKNKDIIETIDALLDILYVVYGMGCSLGYDMDEEFLALYCEFNEDSSDEEAANMTNYQKVLDYCTKIKMVYPNRSINDIFSNENIINNYYQKNMNDDLVEIEKWVSEKNIGETIYSLAQMMFTAYSMGCSLGVDMDKGFELVHSSNMSKVCQSEDIAISTVEYYIDAYNKGTEPYDSPNYRLSDDGKYYVVYNESTSKILKSIEYHVVDLLELVDRV